MRVGHLKWLATPLLLGLLAPGTARAEGAYKRLSLTLNAPYLLVPLYQVNAEVAVHEKWGVALRGGYGRPELLGVESRIMEFGGQAAYYLIGNASRGMQLGIDARVVDYEGGGKLSGLGDGVAVGPFAGYKRVFGSGFTLCGQLGAQVAAKGDSDGPVLPFVALSLGLSFGSAGESPATESAAPVPAARPVRLGPLDYHRGLLIGFSLGGGASVVDGCDACEISQGIAVDASLGWFLGRRFALMYDTTVMVGFTLDRLASAGVGLGSLALQYWPHQDIWLKVGVGFARLVTPISAQYGGGGTLAAGYEFHHNRDFNMDFQLRATHASFDRDDGGKLGVDTFVGLVGLHWY